jgi:hypothetical protein
VVFTISQIQAVHEASECKAKRSPIGESIPQRAALLSDAGAEVLGEISIEDSSLDHLFVGQYSLTTDFVLHDSAIGEYRNKQYVHTFLCSAVI